MNELQNHPDQQAPAPQPQRQPASPTQHPQTLAPTDPQILRSLLAGLAPAPGSLTPPVPATTAPPPLNQTALDALQLTHLPLMELQGPPARPRNGKIARLPKLERDMVNRMLANNLPHHQIVGALDECGFTVTERNISNWRTRGGYKEWCAAQ